MSIQEKNSAYIFNSPSSNYSSSSCYYAFIPWVYRMEKNVKADFQASDKSSLIFQNIIGKPKPGETVSWFTGCMSSVSSEKIKKFTPVGKFSLTGFGNVNHARHIKSEVAHFDADFAKQYVDRMTKDFDTNTKMFELNEAEKGLDALKLMDSSLKNM